MTKHEILKKVFGHDAFRDGQEKLIDELLNGYDVLGVMPTGAGKSVCYQIPALMLDGIALVVSPLISLMKDQVMSLKAAGVAAAYINSSLTPGQQQEAIRRASNGMYKIIYVAPERLRTPTFIRFAQQANISLVAVDEAHCVSQWGQDFRPSYLHIAEFVKSLPKRPPVAAFTATATSRVREDVVRLLELIEPYCLLNGFNRPNLRFSCVKPSSKFAMLISFLKTMGNECGIIYCNTRKTVEDLTEKLRDHGYSATRYHAGLMDEERRRNQDDFQYDRARLMVATNAFGMGIDKSNVRFVVHYNMPHDLESYYQEAGRAGRDGEPAECLLLYSGQDVITAKWMIERTDANPDLTDEQRQAIQKNDLERLRQMTYYATSSSCLRRFILHYFGEKNVPDRCENCSVCNEELFEVDNGNERLRTSSSKAAAQRPETAFGAWQRALLESLKTLRNLLAAQQHVPAYTVFSDASLADMIKRRPMTPDDFLDVSGVGVAKQQKYSQAFLRVIRDGWEPNAAADEYAETVRQKEKMLIRERWSAEEDEQLKSEYFGEMPIEKIAEKHGRSAGAIRLRLQKLSLIE